MPKVYDLAVKTGTYTQNGQEKARWKTVGSLWTDDKGGQYIRLDRAFNPAGVPTRTEGDDTIFVSCFEPKAKGEDF